MRRAFTLLEVVVALAILGLALLAIFDLNAGAGASHAYAKRITVAKVATTPENRALGTVRGLQRALALQGKSGGDVVYVGHGMTTATARMTRFTPA